MDPIRVRLTHALGLILISTVAACAGGSTTGPRVAPPREQRLLPPVSTSKTPPREITPGDRSGEVVRPCAKDTDDAKAAATQIDALDAKIDALAANASGEAVGKEIESLLEGPCFGLVSAPYPFEFDSGLAVKKWWLDGGKWWLENQLALGLPRDPAAMPGTTHHLVVPPTARKSLAADVHKKSPLLPLLCPADAALPDSKSTCGRETRGWMFRAEMAFSHAVEAKRSKFLDLSPQPEPPPTREKCLADAKAAPAELAFSKYSECVHETAQRTDALPLGRYAAPTEGWIVLRGRRGHHGFCDEIRAYDLATGSAYIAKSCGGLVLMPGGSVNGPATSATRQSSALVGRLPIEPLREAALLIMLSETADHDAVLSAFGWFIPPEIAIQMPERRHGGLGMSGGWSSGRTVMEASWVLGGRGQARAAVHWPDADEAAREHATELLAIAELGFVSGCAPAAMPELPWASMGARLDKGENYIQTFDDSPVFAQLRAELDRLRARPLCKKTKSGS